MTRELLRIPFLVFMLIWGMTMNAAEPLGVPDRDEIEYPDDEEHTDEEILLGKTLFFDHRLSIN